MRTRTRSPMRCASRFRDCANGSANRGWSRRWPASAIASTQELREASVDRAPGLSVRLKLALSYAAFLLVAGTLLLGVVWVFLLRYVPDREIIALGFIPN